MCAVNLGQCMGNANNVQASSWDLHAVHLTDYNRLQLAAPSLTVLPAADNVPWPYGAAPALANGPGKHKMQKATPKTACHLTTQLAEPLSRSAATIISNFKHGNPTKSCTRTGCGRQNNCPWLDAVAVCRSQQQEPLARLLDL